MSLSIVYHLCFYFLVIWRNFTLTQSKMKKEKEKKRKLYIEYISKRTLYLLLGIKLSRIEYLKRDQQLRDEPLEATVPMINIVFDNV
ncbi:unnamed protein product [Rhizophagus irregularis]|nr:unnamed protein product [Rhizophagus irregularis]